MSTIKIVNSKSSFRIISGNYATQDCNGVNTIKFMIDSPLPTEEVNVTFLSLVGYVGVQGDAELKVDGSSIWSKVRVLTDSDPTHNLPETTLLTLPTNKEITLNLSALIPSYIEFGGVLKPVSPVCNEDTAHPNYVSSTVKVNLASKNGNRVNVTLAATQEKYVEDVS
jgi:hypothetical protein